MSGSDASGLSTNAKLNNSFKKGSVLNRIRAGEEPFPRDTPLVPKSDITLDQLMHDEQISYLEAVEVMFRLRKESNLAEMPFVPKPKAKAKGKAKALPAAPEVPSTEASVPEDCPATQVDMEGLQCMYDVQKASKPAVEAPAGPDGSEARQEIKRKASESAGPAKSVEPVAKAKVSGKAVEPATTEVSAKASVAVSKVSAKASVPVPKVSTKASVPVPKVTTKASVAVAKASGQALQPAVPKVPAEASVPVPRAGKALEPAAPKVSAKAGQPVPTKVSTPTAKAPKRTVEPSVPAEVSGSGVEPKAKVAKTARGAAKASGKAVEPAVAKVSPKATDDGDCGGHGSSMDNCETQTLSSGWPLDAYHMSMLLNHCINLAPCLHI